MKKFKIFLILILISGIPITLFAEEEKLNCNKPQDELGQRTCDNYAKAMSPPNLKLDCSKQLGTNELNFCTGFEAQKADKKLQNVLASLQDKYSTCGKNVGEDKSYCDIQLKQLKEAQENWQKYMDKQCEYETEGMRQGSAYASTVINCHEQHIEQRMEELRE